MNIGTLYQNQSPRVYQDDYAREADTQIRNAYHMISTIDGNPTKTEHWKSIVSTDLKHAKKVKVNARHFAFNFTDPNTREHLFRQLPKVMEAFFNKLPLSARWLVQYEFESGWKSFIVNREAMENVLEQVRSQSNVQVEEFDDSGLASGSAFACHIRAIKQLHFLDITAYPKLATESARRPKKEEPKEQKLDLDLKQKEQLLKAFMRQHGISDSDLKNMSLKDTQYKNREGGFFKYTCSFPLDLERFQIFNKIDMRTAKILDRVSCIIWAFEQAGLEPEQLDTARATLQTRVFPQSKLKDIAEALNVTFHIRYYRPNDNKTDTYKYIPSSKKPTKEIKLVLFDGHYMLDESLPVSPFAIKNYEAIRNHRNASKWTFEEQMRTVRYVAKKDAFERSNSVKTNIMQIIKTLFECDYFRPIHFGDFATYSTTLYKHDLAPLHTLRYNPEYCTRLKQPYEKKPNATKKKSKYVFDLKKVIYAYFECSTDGVHKAYNICAMTTDGKELSAFGDDCAFDFLNWNEVIDGTQIYFHNLSYDINFLIGKFTQILGTPIIKSGRTLSLDCRYKGKVLRFKDSFAVISKRLNMFPKMFNLADIQKEVFPYTYYTSGKLQDSHIGNIEDAAKTLKNDVDRQQFIENLEKIDCIIDKDSFDMEKYSTFYCMQDVRILKEGFEKFRNDLLKEFDIDAYYFVSISSIANRLFEKTVYWKNHNLYDVSGTPREFISRAVHGGRCMTAHNEKQMITDKKICDFDAVSLYPSAIARLYTMEGVPKVIGTRNVHWLIDHLMDDDQEIPTLDKFIAGFVIEIEIKRINKLRAFPLIVYNPAFQSEPDENIARSSNTCCTMYVDHITLMDLIKYQKISFRFIRGYYWDGKRDFSIRDAIRNLFNLRLKYKAENNPVQEIIKLILNSVYGKTILKPIDTKIVFKTLEESAAYINKNYNLIDCIEHIYGCNFVKFKKATPISRHFNFCVLGVNILSMSKRIMNEVMCLAEDNDISIFYQDTDSMHIYLDDVPKLAELFEQRYGRKLIGSDLGQFHSDFTPINNEVPWAKASIFCGKKSYLDVLTDSTNSIAFHARMKGITMEAIAAKANEMFPNDCGVRYDECGLFKPIEDIENYEECSIYKLYEFMYNGNPVEFDLCSGKPCFDMKSNYSIETKEHFYRQVQF